MNLGKVLGLAALGVGAVAAAPFTGGGSVLGAATLAGSLAGTGTIAAAAGLGVAGAATGYGISRKDKEREEEDNKKDKELAKLKAELEKIKKSLEVLHSDMEYFNFIIAATAVGLATANADGNISEDELIDINEFVGGIGNSQYPQHVKDSLQELKQNIPSLGTVMKCLEKIPPESVKSLEELIEIVIMSDGYEHESEKRFRIAFQELVKDVVYKKDDSQNNETKFLEEAKNNIEYILHFPEVA
ncbi:hypothetical protein CPG37_08855 [Malaciobacter canalis]|uniref:Co-chaperone DjlA N-terminal domain-containing protein n=1 Tax=Malaciobacter canalis TaxID=1912871 RepID=A0ABX4LNZ6_9BACT|nr:hypothetical protein [Malaciobacter canalis]PHO09600.1 hypothetical protein CPG37_08855 [Malaciobacter canalis]QEE31667.1 hypothetical protein ACAN_0131 [Malaciobacter canalis]